MRLSPYGIQNNISALGLNPALAIAPRLAMRCVPCLSIAGTLPSLATLDDLPQATLSDSLPGLTSRDTLPDLTTPPCHC